MKIVKYSQIFLKAAEFQFYYLVYGRGETPYLGKKMQVSEFACDNIGFARAYFGLPVAYTGTSQHDIFEEYFEPTETELAKYKVDGELGFWDCKDQEARILALLFCYHILKDEDR